MQTFDLEDGAVAQKCHAHHDPAIVARRLTSVYRGPTLSHSIRGPFQEEIYESPASRLTDSRGAAGGESDCPRHANRGSHHHCPHPGREARSVRDLAGHDSAS